MAAKASRLIVAKGRKIREFSGKEAAGEEAVLGPTGNLRAPTIRVGRTLLVGFDEDTYARCLT